ncbi:MAG: sterol desaturase family protein, partial [Myxococcaceae bacterium]|nr:sterol desaturase family protein [Myxococcaceae bacterium]
MDPSAMSFPVLLLACALVCLALTAVGLVLGYVSERRASALGRTVFAVKLAPGQVAHEALGTALFQVVFVPVLALAFATGVLRFSQGWAAQLLGFAVPWYGFQALYYWLHRAMHTKPLFWMHRWHHVSHVTTPMTGFSMHPVESLGWCVVMLGPAVALAQLGLLGAWGFGAFLAVFFVGNIAGHANAEIFPVRATRLSSILTSNPIS